MTPGTSTPPIARRIVFHLAGYDFAHPAEQHRIFSRELARFTHTWRTQASCSPAPDTGERLAHWHVATTGPGWRCETSYRLLRWDDIVHHELHRGHIARLFQSIPAFLDFLLAGTALRYLHRFWPAFLVFAFPYATLGLFALIAATAALLIGSWPGLIAGPALFATLYLATARRWRLAHALDLWRFSRAYAHGRQPAIHARIDSFASTLLAALDEPGVNEILLVGHSLGSTLALDVLARALALRPDLDRHTPPIRLLTVGSFIAQLGLHPRGARIRAAATTVAASAIDWAEYQACDDPLNFYKVNPVTFRHQRDYLPGSRPTVRRVHIRDMLSPAIFHRFRHRWVRLHYQFLMANDIRAPYDFFMFACGPVPFRALVAAPRGPVDFFDADTRLLDQNPAGNFV